MLIRSFDFETTGTPSEDDPQAVCEVGFCDVEVEGGTVTIGEPWAAICNPGRPMPAPARAVHHIDDATAARGLLATTAFMRLMGGDLDAPRPDCFCAHNSEFELNFFKGGGIPVICTFKIACRLWPDEESHSLQHLRYSLKLDINQLTGLPAHRAGPDAYVGAALMARILTEPGAPDIPTMVRWSKGPALFQRLNFGKHRGKRYDEVPEDYLFWLCDKSEMGADVKANARHWLKQRAQKLSGATS